MSSRSLAQQILLICDRIDRDLNKIVEEIPPAMIPRVTNLHLAASQLRTAAEARVTASQNESARRHGSTSGTVMAQGGSRD